MDAHEGEGDGEVASLEDDGMSAMEARLAGITLVRKPPASTTTTPTRGMRSMSLAVSTSSSRLQGSRAAMPVDMRIPQLDLMRLDPVEEPATRSAGAWDDADDGGEGEDGFDGAVKASPAVHGAYVQLLRDRNRELELELRAQQQALTALQTQHQVQSLELQRVLVASLQRHSSVMRSGSASGRHVLTPASLEALLGNLEATSAQLQQAGRAVDGLRPCIADNVLMEGELHRCAMQQADHIKAVDAHHPNGIVGMTAREHEQLQMLKEELAHAAQEKDRVAAALDTMLTDIRKGIETATEVLGAAAAVASEALARVSEAALPNPQTPHPKDAEEEEDGMMDPVVQQRESAAFN